MPSRRYVQVFIADPDENIPVENCLLFTDSPKVTDATDQELFFEINIKDLLDKHNLERIKIRNKKIIDKEVYLEPARVRDLKMTVVTIATF